MHDRHALGGQLEGELRKADVVVDQRGAVADLDEHVAAAHAAEDQGDILRGRVVVVEEVATDAGALSLPVEPDAHGGVVDVVAADRHVDGGVQLDARDLRARQLLHVVDVVDVVVLDRGEHAAHAADDAGLLAVVDVAAADDVVADALLGPAVVLAAADRVALHLRGALDMARREVVVVLGVEVLAERDAAALAVGDLAVLDDPALGPVGADHAVLIGGGGRPGGGGLLDIKAADRDVVHAGFGGQEAVAADVDLHLLGVGIIALEVGVDHGLVAVLLGVPLIGRELSLPGVGIGLGLDAGLEALHLVELAVVEIDRAGVAHEGAEVPVALDERGVGVIAAEGAVAHAVFPHAALELLPALGVLRAGDDRAEGLLAAVGDARVLFSGEAGIDILPVDAGGHDDLVSGAGDLRGVVDVPEGAFFAAVSVLRRLDIDVDLHRCSPFGLFLRFF